MRRHGAPLAVSLVFVGHAAPFASWVPHIPEVKAGLGLTDPSLGLVLLGAPVGSVAGMVGTGLLVGRLGSRRIVAVALAGNCVVGVAVGLAATAPALFGALALWGAFQGSLDVAMNTQAVAVERAIERPVMSGFHATWSLGGLLGAGAGAAGVALGAAAGTQLLVSGAVIAAFGGWACRRLVDDPRAEQGLRPGLRAAGDARAVVVLGAVAMACMLCEGSAADWSGVYLRESVGASAWLAAAGFAAFSAGMVGMRLAGDRLLGRFGARRLLPALAGAATLCMASALVSSEPVVGVLGWAGLGAGVALVIPAAFSAAGRLGGVGPGAGIAAVSTVAWVGWVGGPPLIGGLAGAVGLPSALAVVPVLTAVIAVVTRVTRAFEGGARPDG